MKITPYLTLLLLPLSLSAQQPIDPAAQIDSFLSRAVTYNHFNGNVLAAREGRILFQKAYGYKDYRDKTPLDNNTVFELASVSKQFTAVGILLLVEQGRLKLDDSLRKFFPELPYHNITIKQLLTHTGGLPDYMDAMAPKWDHHTIAFNKDMIAFFAKEKTKPDFAPGTKCEYSNTGYAMLASIIEKVSGQPLHTYLQSKIFGPLGMQRTRIYNTRRSKHDTIPDYAYGVVYNEFLHRYILPDSLPAYDMVYYLDGIQGDGVVNSTTGDLLKWDRALKEHRLLSQKMQQEMFSPLALLDTANARYYGYGEMMGTNELGPFITHSGGWPGYVTLLMRYTQPDLTLIVLSNNESPSSRIAGAIAYILSGKEVVMPYEHKEIAIDSNLVVQFAGNYTIEAVPKDQPLQLIAKNGKLYRHIDGKDDLQLKPESSTKFFYPNQSDQQIEFLPAGGGYFIVGGMKKLLKRIPQ